MIIVGIDEAGYGPPLGPLTVSRSVFEILSNEFPDFWKINSEIFSDGKGIGDSKKIFNQSSGLKNLETPIFAFTNTINDKIPSNLYEALELIYSDKIHDQIQKIPWYSKHNTKLSPDYKKVSDIAGKIRLTFTMKGVRFHGLNTRPVFALEFNKMLDKIENKANVLFSIVSDHITEVCNQYPNDDVTIFVDKLGGRDQYEDHLSGLMIGRVDPIVSSREESIYEIENQGRKITIGFYKKGDDKHFPISLASMSSKYIRELCMKSFNSYWKELVDGYKKTAGYPTDALRFLEDTKEAREDFRISDEILIRRK